MESAEPAVVIDNGSDTIKAGLVGEDVPSICFPTVVGRPADGGSGIFVGNDIMADRSGLKLSYPIEGGAVKSWEDLEIVWNYTFKEKLRINPGEYNVFLTEPPMAPKKDREKMAKIMFETFKVPAIYIGTQAALALFATGRRSGLVVDSGSDATHITPVFEGFPVREGMGHLEYAGKDISRHLVTLLNEKGASLSLETDADIIKEMKEKLCYVALDYDQEIQKSQTGSVDKNYQLPSGKSITLGSERFQCLEGLFNPQNIGRSTEGLYKATFSSIMKTEMDVRKDLYRNILLTGGTTLFPGFADRMKKEMDAVSPPAATVRVIAITDRRNMVWSGGSLLAAQSFFKQSWLKRSEYEETGPSIVHTKF